MIRYPNIIGKNDSQKLEQMRSYLHQLADELNYQLDRTGNLMSGYPSTANELAKAVVKKDDPISNFNDIKALIIKSADIIDAYYEEINKKLEGHYVAESDFGTFKETTEAQLTASNTKIKSVLTRQEEIDTDLVDIERTMRSEIEQTADSISMSVENGDSTAQIVLKVGDREIPATIDMKGLVTFSNLANADGTTVINGSNITTGQILADLITAGVIKSKDGESVVIDLDKGTASLIGTIKTESESGDDAGCYFSQITPRNVTSMDINGGKGSYLSATEIGAWGEKIATQITKDKVEIRPDPVNRPEDYANYHFLAQVDPDNRLVLLYLQSKEYTAPLQIASANGNNAIRGLSAPTNASDAVNKAYVDALIARIEALEEKLGL